MKILILGDTHGRLLWYDIIQKEQPDLTIFLGDYVSTHDRNVTSEQQLSNLEDILNYKEDNQDKVILLRGNHDMQHLGYHWAECSGWDGKVWHYMSQADFKERFLRLTDWVYVIPDTNIVCSHAGISEDFLRACNNKLFQSRGYTDPFNIIRHINEIEPCELFGFTPNNPFDCTGESPTQPCTWIRPQTLAYYGVKQVTHIVGHTPVAHVCNLHNEAFIKAGYPEDGPDIWVCDCLGTGKEYLVIEDGKFIPKSFNNE